MNENQRRTLESFMALPQPKDKVQCEYVWIDGSIRNMRSKSLTWPKEPLSPEQLPVMEFCGSGTLFDVGNESDFYSHPAKIYRDPFRLNDNRLVLCETRTREDLPTFANNRHRLRMLKEKAITEVTEFSFYQPYTILRTDGKPLSYMDIVYSPDSESGFLCGRQLAESHYKVCLYAGIRICSLEPVSNQGQWKYGIGPRSCVDLGDEVWMSRFLLSRVAEDFGVNVVFNPTHSVKCLRSVSAEVDFSTDHLIQPYRQRIIDDLFCKFGVNEKPLKIVTLPKKIVLKNIISDVDPYSTLTRLIETLSSK